MTAPGAPRLVGGRYVHGERVYPRVSQVLDVINKPGLVRWRTKVGDAEANRISKEARTLGTAIHAVCEAVNRGQLVPMDKPALTPFLRVYQQWYRREVSECVAVEETVWSDRYGFAGTLDVVMRLKDGRLALVDLKSSNSVSETYRAQTAAYAAAYAERTGEMVDTRLVVQMPSREPGALYVTEFDDYPADWQAFRAALALYKWVEAHKDDWKAKGRKWRK